MEKYFISFKFNKDEIDAIKSKFEENHKNW